MVLGNKAVLVRILSVLSTINGLYLMAMLVVHAKGHPSTLKSLKKFDKAAALVALKGLILSTAILTELAIVIHTVRQKTHRTAHFCTSLGRILTVWQLLVFVQITVGLVSMPLLIMVLISPAKCTLTLGLLILPFLLLSYAAVATPCTTHCKNMLKTNLIIGLEITLTVCLASTGFTTYYAAVCYGANMENIEGYILSFIPIVPLSILVWVIKQKLLKKKRIQEETANATTGQEKRRLLYRRRDYSHL